MSIARKKEIFNDPALWPLIYKANRDQIRDPRVIYPGQMLTIPRDSTPAEIAEARKQAATYKEQSLSDHKATPHNDPLQLRPSYSDNRTKPGL